MKLTDEEQALRAGAFGRAAQWAIEHQIKVGRYLGARDFVAVSQAHVMADTESLGAAVHVSVTGDNTHHMIEACFKGVGRALRQAFRRESNELPTTKGVL